MKLSVLTKAKTYQADPFPFVVIEDALPRKLYAELESSFPENLICLTPPLDHGITYRYKSNPVLIDKRVSEVWLEFFEYHTSAEYFRSCLRLFEPYLETHYPELLQDAADARVSVRNIDNAAPFVTDCQFVVHEPIDETRTSRTAHLDNPVEIYAGLFYMKSIFDQSAGGNLVLHEVTEEIKEIKRSHGREVSTTCHKPLVEIPYRSNTFCMFLNLKNSVHSVSPRIGARTRRRSVNMIGELNNSKRMWDIQEIG